MSVLVIHMPHQGTLSCSLYYEIQLSILNTSHQFTLMISYQVKLLVYMPRSKSIIGPLHTLKVYSTVILQMVRN